MKKFLCAILASLMVLTLVACGGGSDLQTVVLTMEQNGTTIDYELVADGDVVQQITQTSTLDGSLYTEEQIDLIMESADEFAAAYAEIDGVTYSIEEKDGDIVETIKIETTDADTIQALSDAGLLPVDQDNATSISLKKTIENLEALGMTVKE